MFRGEIARGSALLTDEQMNDINVTTLRLDDCFDCVLGQ